MQVSCTNNFASAPKYSARMRARPSDDDDFSNEGSGGGSSGSGRFRNFMSLARHNNNKPAIVKDKDRQSSTSSTLTTAGINIKAGSPSSPGRLAARRSPQPQLVASTNITAAAAAAPPPPPNKSSSRRSNNNTRSTDRDGFEENPRIPSSPSGTPPKKIWEGAYSKFLRGNSANSGASSGVSGGGGVSGKPPMAISPKSSPSSSPPNITAATTTTGNMGNSKKSSSFSILPGTKRLVTLSRNGISNLGMATNGANQYATAAVDALDGHSHGGISAPTVPQFPCSRVALNASSGATENGDAGVGNQENPEGEVSVRGGKLFQSVFSRSNNDLARQQSVCSSISRFPTSHRSHQSMDALDVPMRKGVEKTSSASPDIRKSFRKQAEKRVQHQVDSSISSALAAAAAAPPVPAANAYSFSTPVSTLGTTTSREEDDNGDPAKGSETPKSLDDLLASAASTPDCQHLTVTFGNVTGATAATRSVSMGGLIHPMINEGVRLSPSATSSGMLQPRIQGRYSFNNLQLNIPEGGEVKDIPPPPHQINPVVSGGNSFSRIPSSPVQQVGLALDDSDNASNSTEDVQSTPLSHVDRPVHVLESSGNLDQILADASRAQTPPPSRPHSEKKKAFTNFHNASRFANDSTSPFLGAEDDSSNQGDRDQDSYVSYHTMLMQKRRPDHQHSVGGMLSERGTTHTFHHRLNSMPHLVSASLPLDTVDEQNISILKGMRLLKPIQGTESWQQGRRYLITPAVLSTCSLPAINKLVGSTILPASVAADSSSAFGMIDLGEALMTYVGEKHHLSLGKWSSCRLVLRQNYLFEYDIDTPLTGSPRGFCHLQHAIAYPHQDFQDALELQFYASPCAKADQRVLMIRIQKAMKERQQQEEERNNWITCLNDAAQLRIQDLWHFDAGNVFGTGRYASVHPARRKTRQFFQDETGTTKKEEDKGDYDCALKIVDKNEFWRRVVKGRERADTLVRELSVQSTLTSKCGRIPTFSQVRGVFESSDNFVIELELLQGEDLFEYISSKGVLGEDEAALVLYDVLTALEAMSRIGVSHRDVKPANVLLANSEDNELSVKLGDFGMSTFVGVDGLVRGRCGTPGYVAPEILTAATRSGYSGLCDVFSAGVTLYVMLSGYEPFYGETEKELIEANRVAIVEFPDCDWGSISPQARDLLDQMLSSDPTKRITAKDALQHEWILKYASERKKKLCCPTSGAFDNQKSIFSQPRQSLADEAQEVACTII